MKIAVEGCAHGELDKIYEVIEHLEKENNVKIDLLIICGDFQAVRNKSDLQCMAVPRKFQKLNTFHKYYSGEKVAPVLTIFVGGNHEASNYLSELPYGGWVCPNIFYMGYANVIRFGGLRIAGLSGIYKGQDYLKGHFEILPYNESSKRSVYHVRNVDVFRLKQIKQPVDICISHDWPRGIHDYGDKDGLLRFKPFFKDDMENGKLGSRPAEELLHKLKPSYWFAAHLHCQFAAVVPHEDGGQRTFTKFLALDKCLPKRRFLQILEIGEEVESSNLQLEYDKEWLTILRSTNSLLSVSDSPTYMPGPGCSERWDFSVTEEEMEKTAELFPNGFTIPLNFSRTASIHDSSANQSSPSHPVININPQTSRFCKLLGIDDPVELLNEKSPRKKDTKNYSFVDDLNVTNTSQVSLNPDSSLADEDDDDGSSSSDDGGSSLIEPMSCDLDSTGSSGFFFIDKRPMTLTSSPLGSNSLVPPLFDMLERTSSTNISAKSVEQEVDLGSFPEFKEQKDEDMVDETNKKSDDNSMKFFKRRNQSIYMNNDDDDDED